MLGHADEIIFSRNGPVGGAEGIRHVRGEGHGTINIGAVTGGVAPYTYSFNGAAFIATTVYINLAPGNYTVSVKDNNGCIFNAPNVVITNVAGPIAIAVVYDPKGIVIYTRENSRKTNLQDFLIPHSSSKILNSFTLFLILITYFALVFLYE